MKTRLTVFLAQKLLPNSFLFSVLLAAIIGQQALFGPSNSITSVAVVVLFLSSLGQDVNGAPVKWLLRELGALTLIGISSSVSALLPPMAALPVHLVTLLALTYGFTYQYTPHLYFPYLLTYLFLVLLAPLTPAQIPLRLGCLLTGGGVTFLLQLFLSRSRVKKACKAVLVSTLALCRDYAHQAADDPGCAPAWSQVLQGIRSLSVAVHQHRPGEGRLSVYGAVALDGINTLELVLAQLQSYVSCSGAAARPVLGWCEAYLADLSTALEDTASLPAPPEEITGARLLPPLLLSRFSTLYRQLILLRAPNGLRGAMPRPRRTPCQWLLEGLAFSSVRINFALRMSLSVSLALFLVELFQIPWGKWIVFPIFSLGFPYAQDVLPKTGDRLVALVLAGICFVPLFYLVPSPDARGILLMAVGFLSMFGKDYRYTFTCASVSALGSNGMYHLTAVGELTGLWAARLGLNLVGILAVLLLYLRVRPYDLHAAHDDLLSRYKTLIAQLVALCAEKKPNDTQRTWLMCQATICEARLLELHGRMDPHPHIHKVRDLRRQMHKALSGPHRNQETVLR